MDFTKNRGQWRSLFEPIATKWLSSETDDGDEIAC